MFEQIYRRVWEPLTGTWVLNPFRASWTQVNIFLAKSVETITEYLTYFTYAYMFMYFIYSSTLHCIVLNSIKSFTEVIKHLKFFGLQYHRLNWICVFLVTFFVIFVIPPCQPAQTWASSTLCSVPPTYFLAACVYPNSPCFSITLAVTTWKHAERKMRRKEIICSVFGNLHF